MPLDAGKQRNRICEVCGRELSGRQKKTCSRDCSLKKSADNRRGKGASYIRIRINGKRVYLHRHIFETQVRPLEADEIVHHKDENKWNNDPSNLEAIRDQAEHLRRHNFWRHRRPKRETYSDADLDWLASI